MRYDALTWDGSPHIITFRHRCKLDVFKYPKADDLKRAGQVIYWKSSGHKAQSISAIWIGSDYHVARSQMIGIH